MLQEKLRETEGSFTFDKFSTSLSTSPTSDHALTPPSHVGVSPPTPNHVGASPPGRPIGVPSAQTRGISHSSSCSSDTHPKPSGGTSPNLGDTPPSRGFVSLHASGSVGQGSPPTDPPTHHESDAQGEGAAPDAAHPPTRPHVLFLPPAARLPHLPPGGSHQPHFRRDSAAPSTGTNLLSAPSGSRVSLLDEAKDAVENAFRDNIVQPTMQMLAEPSVSKPKSKPGKVAMWFSKLFSSKKPKGTITEKAEEEPDAEPKREGQEEHLGSSEPAVWARMHSVDQNANQNNQRMRSPFTHV